MTTAWLRSQSNVSKWSGMSTYGLLLLSASSIKIWLSISDSTKQGLFDESVVNHNKSILLSHPLHVLHSYLHDRKLHLNAMGGNDSSFLYIKVKVVKFLCSAQL